MRLGCPFPRKYDVLALKSSVFMHYEFCLNVAIRSKEAVLTHQRNKGHVSVTRVSMTLSSSQLAPCIGVLYSISKLHDS